MIDLHYINRKLSSTSFTDDSKETYLPLNLSNGLLVFYTKSGSWFPAFSFSSGHNFHFCFCLELFYMNFEGCKPLKKN